MRRLHVILLIFILWPIFIVSQTLNSNAEYIKSKYPSEFENTLKKYALQKWNTDYEMVAYEINQQADALVSIVQTFKSENSSILFNAIRKWSIKGFENQNIQYWNDSLEVVNFKLLHLHCDWDMVQYEYDKQVTAKNAIFK